MNSETMSIIRNRYGNNFDKGWNGMSAHRRHRFENRAKDIWCF